MGKIRHWADARNRAARTFMQGLVAAVLLAAWPVVQAALDEGVSSVDWSVLRVSLLNAAVTAVVTFVWRTVLDPSRIPSATPPVAGG